MMTIGGKTLNSMRASLRRLEKPHDASITRTKTTSTHKVRSTTTKAKQKYLKRPAYHTGSILFFNAPQLGCP